MLFLPENGNASDRFLCRNAGTPHVAKTLARRGRHSDAATHVREPWNVSVPGCFRIGPIRWICSAQLSSALNRGTPVSSLARRNDDRIVETDIPARLDSLRWSGFHTRVVLALGITWILDGLEVTLAGALSGALKESPTLRFSNFDVGFANSAYLAGAVLGALGFGWLTDRIGRKKLFFITLALYLTATAATALSWNVASYALFRFLTGAGIGGEYTAINSTIQELVPARYRGWTDLVINGSFWIGAAIGAVSAIVLLDPALIGPDLGWRLAYLTGAGLGLVVFVMRMWIPESPRWLMIHGRPDQAHAIVADIERSVKRQRAGAAARTPGRRSG